MNARLGKLAGAAICAQDVERAYTNANGLFFSNLTVTLTKPQLLAFLGGVVDAGGLATVGDASVLDRLRSYLDAPVGSFPIVTP